MKTNDGNRKVGYFALAMLFLVACALQPVALAQMTSTGIDCSQIAAAHVMQQDNMRAGLALIECGVIKGGQPGDDEATGNPPPYPPNVLVSDRSCASGSTCTKSESMVWANGDTIVVNYNDHNVVNGVQNYSGTSYSLDGGVTFTELIPPPFSTGHGTNYGDPIVVYNAALGEWFAGDLVSGGNCGSQGIGLWTSPDGITWTPGACAHVGHFDDRESMWVDNNPTSAGYGCMFISYNDFWAGADLFVTHSCNNGGTNWSTPFMVTSTFIRDVQITGTPPGLTLSGTYSTVFLAAMDEGAGGCAAGSRTNLMYLSTNGGSRFTPVTGSMGPAYNPVCDQTCPSNSYFAEVNPIWRHMGWGEPGVGLTSAGGQVVHYAYAGQGVQPNDHGDIYYVRSVDNGTTWSAPIVLNDDPGGQYKTQWMPSLSVNSSASSLPPYTTVSVSWYDRRQATSACNVPTDPGCSYQVYGVQSRDNGLTWSANFAVTDQLVQQPTQNDPGVQACYAGDYNYDTALGRSAWVTWTDGRVAVGGVQVQNVNFQLVAE